MGSGQSLATSLRSRVNNRVQPTLLGQQLQGGLHHLCCTRKVGSTCTCTTQFTPRSGFGVAAADTQALKDLADTPAAQELTQLETSMCPSCNLRRTSWPEHPQPDIASIGSCRSYELSIGSAKTAVLTEPSSVER